LVFLANFLGTWREFITLEPTSWWLIYGSLPVEHLKLLTIILPPGYIQFGVRFTGYITD